MRFGITTTHGAFFQLDLTHPQYFIIVSFLIYSSEIGFVIFCFLSQLPSSSDGGLE